MCAQIEVDTLLIDIMSPVVSSFRSRKLAALLLLLVGGLSCSSRPPRLVAPEIDPEAATDRALESYDSDTSGELSSAELAACPGVTFNVQAYDADGNGRVSRDEFLARLEYLVGLKFALSPVRARVRLNGRPLEGAQVEFVPEPYLGEHVKPAQGTTDRSGTAIMSVAPADLPKAQSELKGVHTGTYRVRITHPDKQLPAKYNSETTLGYETRIGDPRAVFELTN